MVEEPETLHAGNRPHARPTRHGRSCLFPFLAPRLLDSSSSRLSPTAHPRLEPLDSIRLELPPAAR
jgi:hypothetical protein